MEQELNLQNFLYQRQRYHGEFTPENLVFNANLQEFAARVGYISNLQTRGKLSEQESYEQMENLWEQLKRSYLALNIEKETQH